MKSRIMYIENKAHGLTGEARIGRVTYSKSGRTLYYKGKQFGHIIGFKANYQEYESGTHYWISGCKKQGSNRLYGERVPVEIDDDVREEYWTQIRKTPHKKHEQFAEM